MIGQGRRCAQHQIVRIIAQCRREGTIQCQRQPVRRLDSDKIMDIGEDDQAVELVIAVVTTTNDMEIEVDFGWR